MWDVASNPYGDYDWYSSYEFDYENINSILEGMMETMYFEMYDIFKTYDINATDSINVTDGINGTNGDDMTEKRTMFLRQLEDVESGVKNTLKLIKDCTLKMDAYQQPEACGVSKTNLQKASLYTQEGCLLTSSFLKSLDPPRSSEPN